VANAILYDIVANVAAIPASPANNDAVEVTDSTGIQSFTPLTGVPAGFVGSSGLSVRLVYTTTGSTWNWIQYFPNDPETRYLKLAGGTLTGDLTVANQGDIRLGEATANGSNYVAIQAPSSLAANVTYTLPSADGTSGQLLSTNGSGALSWATTSNDIIQEGNSSAEVIDTGSDGRFVVTTEGSERLRVDSSGRLGIGTTSPGELLHVYNSAATSRLIVGPSGTGAATPNALALEQENTGYTVCHVRNLYNNAGLGELRLGGYGFTTFTSGSSQTERARIDSSGRLLVGTSSPRSWSGVTSNIQLEGTDFNASSISQTLNSNNDNGAYLALNKSRGTSNGSQTVVQSGDQVGAIYFNGADGSSLRQAARIEAIVDGTPGASDMPGRLVFSTTSDGAAVSTERLRIANDGKMGFGTTTLTGKFNFDGSVFLFTQPSGAGNSTLKFNTSTGAVTYDTSSRLVKQNIEDCPYGLVELAQLKPRKYFRTDDQKIEIGFVADEVANVLPEFVPIGPKYIITKNEVDTEEIPLGVNYEKLTAVLTKALQETISEIESLKARVAALESPTTTLEIPVDPSSTDI
jgi:hypothetical protein